MTVLIPPLSEISDRARKVLIQELGIIDALRFLSQFRAGHGDYTLAREQLFQGESVESIVTAIKALRIDQKVDPSGGWQ